MVWCGCVSFASVVLDYGFFFSVGSTVSLAACFVVVQFWFVRCFGATGSNACVNWVWIWRFLVL